MKKNGGQYKHMATISLIPRPSYGKIEKGSGQKGHTSLSQWNLIGYACVCALNRYVMHQRMRTRSVELSTKRVLRIINIPFLM